MNAKAFILLQLRPGTAPLLPSASIKFSPLIQKKLCLSMQTAYINILFFFCMVVNAISGIVTIVLQNIYIIVSNRSCP